MEWFTYTGVEDIPDHVTHVFVDVKTIPSRAFSNHRNIIEVICHEEVEKIEEYAFTGCPSLRRVFMPGIKIVEEGAFDNCSALTDVECGKLEIIEQWAFCGCESLRSINLPSARIVEERAFAGCRALASVKFNSKMERLDFRAFGRCFSLERITIPLKDGMIADDTIFRGCESLNHVDLVEGALHETIAALQLEEWRNDMSAEIDSINQILPDANAGGHWDAEIDDISDGEKAQAIRIWIRSVLDKIIRYKAEHGSVLDDAATTLQLALPRDIVFNNVLPLLELPSHTFDGEGEEEVQTII